MLISMQGLSREEAEDWLKRVGLDRAFLVRASESVKNSFVISFRCFKTTCCSCLCNLRCVALRY